MKSMKKTIALAVAIAMIFGCVVGGTIAWLIDNTAAVTNTFTYGNIDITLTESENLDLKMVPGKDITKDPKVTVTANSEKCYVFVKIDKSATYGDFLENYTVAAGWTEVETGVYYRVVDTSTSAQEFKVLNNDTVSVKEGVTKTAMDGLADGTTAAPTLTFTAYAVQFADLADQNGDSTVNQYDAWALAKPTA